MVILEKALDVIHRYIKDWLCIEKDLRTKAEVKDAATQISIENEKLHNQGRAIKPCRAHNAMPKTKDSVHTSADQQEMKAQIDNQKRRVTSLVEQGKEKKKNESKSSDNWRIVEQ
ncbi:hypothetical protein KM043_013404 [Ampulex compressa]|nr:hypothetical protein KM043_013404 [Ampulex compressa]